jgi:hypothetical protein
LISNKERLRGISDWGKVVISGHVAPWRGIGGVYDLWSVQLLLSAVQAEIPSSLLDVGGGGGGGSIAIGFVHVGKFYIPF